MAFVRALGPLHPARVLALLLACGACGGTEIDPTGLPSIADHTTWDSFVTLGAVPGHGDTYRVIYRNDIARNYAHAGKYPDGAVIVKEVYDLAAGDGRGDLNYLAIMRRIDDPPPDIPAADGWLFTDKRGDSETQLDLCWGCHRQAPYDGAWFDHGL
jgi:hypothetical protein